MTKSKNPQYFYPDDNWNEGKWDATIEQIHHKMENVRSDLGELLNLNPISAKQIIITQGDYKQTYSFSSKYLSEREEALATILEGIKKDILRLLREYPHEKRAKEFPWVCVTVSVEDLAQENNND